MPTTLPYEVHDDASPAYDIHRCTTRLRDFRGTPEYLTYFDAYADALFGSGNVAGVNAAHADTVAREKELMDDLERAVGSLDQWLSRADDLDIR